MHTREHSEQIGDATKHSHPARSACRCCPPCLFRTVIWLEISVNDFLPVHALECEYHLSGVEPALDFGHEPALGEVEAQVPAVAERHHEEQLALILERVLQRQQERIGVRVGKLGHDVSDKNNDQ